jgi:hypothetical protein
VTATGTLVGILPGSGDQVPLQGRDVAVDVQDYGSSSVTATLHATTDSAGRYAVATTLDSSVPYFQSRFTENSDEVDGSTDTSAQPTVQYTAVTVTAAADHTRVLPGGTFKVSGVVRYGQSAPSTAPVVAGAQVGVQLSCYGIPYDPVHAPEAVTDATGHYSVTVIGDPECDGGWTASTTGFLIRSPSPAGHVAFPDESSFSGVSSKIDTAGYVTVTGKLLRTYHRASPYDGQNTFLWYSPNGKTNWTRLKGATTDYTGAFKLVAWGYVDGYYQVRHTDTDQLAASNGPIVHLTRTDTRVVSLKANKTRVKKNTVIAVSGTLQQLTKGAWRSYGKQHVELYFLAKNAKSWKYVSSSTTGTNGLVIFHPKVTGDGKWIIQYFGDSTHFSSGATAVSVDMI